MLIPYQVDVPMSRWPIMNFALIGVISLFSLMVMFGGDGQSVRDMVLDGWAPKGLFGHMLLHADFIHLFGNMLFLWVFGNAVCAKITNIAYLPLFLFFGLVAAGSHLTIDGDPAIGASGAINGVVGMYLLLYPLNNVSCIWLFGLYSRSFSFSGMWLILLWLIFDLWGATTGSGGVAYWAHLGGFAAGACIGAVLLSTRMVVPTDSEQSLFDVIAGRE